MVFHQRVHYDINHYHVCGMHTQLYHSGVAVSSSKQETSLFLGNFGISIYSTISCFSSEYFNSDLVFFRKHLVCSSSCSDSTDDISKYCTVVMSETENLFKWDKGFTQNLTWTVFKWMLLCVKQTLVNFVQVCSHYCKTFSRITFFWTRRTYAVAKQCCNNDIFMVLSS